MALPTMGRKFNCPTRPLTIRPSDYFTIAVGGRPTQLQVMAPPPKTKRGQLSPEMERGLMERRDLGPEQGMVFVFDRPQRLKFWMHNTPTPLDVGYFSPKGELVEIYALNPFNEHPVASRRADLQFAVEMNQGWYRDRGVSLGARLDLKALAIALRLRGFDPKTLGLGRSA
jgi:uncharacterized membrane protein (UPF0127 family)